MALFTHGFRRFTEDVDILTTQDGLREIHKKLVGRGYVRPFTGSKNIRDAELGIRIEFLIEGQYPGDGKPKPVAFPNPEAVSIELDDIEYINLETMIELKLASGLSNKDRIKDLADVQKLIKILGLPEDIKDHLNPYVRSKYIELWNAVRKIKRRYIQIWRNKFLTVHAISLEEMINNLNDSVVILKAMKADGVTLDPDGGTADDYAYLVTTDPAIAGKYGMHDESEFWGHEIEEENDDGI